MRARGSWVTFLAIALAFAGCVKPDAGGATRQEEPLASALVASPAAPLAGDASPEAETPVWRVGDAWAITSSGFGSEERSHLVVVAADTDSYTLATTSEQAAAFDAMFDVSYVGKIRAADLAGHQQGTAVKYFDFPLADGKTWVAKWDGLDVALTATKSARGFDITGTAEGEPYVEYDYVPDLKWWSRIHFLQGDYGFRVDRAETEWRGEVLTATASVVYEAAPQAPTFTSGTGSFTVAEGQSFLLASLEARGAQWQRAFYLVDPAGQPYPTTGIQNLEGELAGTAPYRTQEQLPATPGEWRIVLEGAHDPTGGFWLTVHQVAVAATAFP